MAQRGDNLPMVTWLVGMSWGMASRAIRPVLKLQTEILRAGKYGPGAKSGSLPAFFFFTACQLRMGFTEDHLQLI